MPDQTNSKTKGSSKKDTKNLVPSSPKYLFEAVTTMQNTKNTLINGITPLNSLTQTFCNSSISKYAQIASGLSQVNVKMNLLGDLFPSNDEQSFKPLEIIKDVSTRHDKIILFDMIKIEEESKINEYCSSHYGETLFVKDNYISKDSFQQTMKTITNISLSVEQVSNINLHSAYYYGKFFCVMYECVLCVNNSTEVGNDIDILNRRLNKFKSIQKKVEEAIPDELKGIFGHKKLFRFSESSGNSIPCFYIYSVEDYSSFFDDRKNTFLVNGPSTNREKAEEFLIHLSEFDGKDDIKYDNSKFLGVNQDILLGVIDKKLIVSQVNEYLQDASKPIPYKFTILSFDKTSVLTFCYEFISMYYLFIALELLLQEFKDVSFSQFAQHKSDLISFKDEFLKQKLSMSTLIDDYEIYKQLYNHFKKDKFQFQEEETWTYNVSAKKGSHRYSVSDYLGNYCKYNIEEIERKKTRLITQQNDTQEIIKHEEQLNADKPIINTLFKDVEPELIIQIRKWKNKIPKEDIEQWLANFNTTDEKRKALLLLNKLTYFATKDLIPFIKASYNNLHSQISEESTILYSPIGKLTGGSHHMLKLFQETNGLQDIEFKDFSSIEGNKETILILVDDFIGSGKTFVKFFNENKENIESFKEAFYVCPIALKQGIDFITNKSSVKVIYSYELGEELQIDKITGLNNTEIIHFLDKYKGRIPEKYLYGFDNCRVLITFDTNIPNNTLGIFWYSQNWIPLFQRK